MKKESDSESQNKILLWWINTTKSKDFQDKKMPRVGSNYVFLGIILSDLY